MQNSPSKLVEFKDKHKGKPGFIVGTGYSLNNVDVSKMCASGVTFVCNAAALTVPNPDYFMFCDGHIPYFAYYDSAIRAAKNVCCANLELKRHLKHIKPPIKKYLLDRKYDDRSNLKFDYAKLICGLNIAHVAAHFAWVCGCDPLILVGMDCDIAKGKYAIEASKLKRKPTWPFAAGPIQTPMLNGVDMYLASSIAEWRRIKAQNPSINIINASSGSLDCFKRVNVEAYYKN